MAKYAIFSDFHLGNGGKHDLFGHKDYPLIRILSKLLSKNYTIILNGDVYEYWKFSERAILKAHRVLVNFIRNSPRIICLVGNHDYDVMGHFTYLFEMKSGRQVLVSHGFQNDRWMYHPFMKFTVILAGMLERFLGIQLERVFSKIYSSQFDKNIEKNTLEYAKRMFARHDIVVCGHTHIQTRAEFLGKTYLNSGHALGNRIQYIKINTRKETIKLVNKKIKLKD